MINKTIIITGASSGIGEHLAKMLYSKGASIIVAARRMDRIHDLIYPLRENAIGIELDVTSKTSVQGFYDTLDNLEIVPDVLINNAGIVAGGGSFMHVTQQALDASFQTNTLGAWRMTREFVKRTSKGAVVNVASILGIRQQNDTFAYSVSKAALIQATKLMALEAAPTHRVNAVAPGYIKTPEIVKMFESYGPYGTAFIESIPQQRFGELTDLDGPITLLVSDESSYMTGAVLEVDGGHLLKSL